MTRLTLDMARGRILLAEYLEAQDSPDIQNDAAASEWIEESRRAAARIRRHLRQSEVGCAALHERLKGGGA